MMLFDRWLHFAQFLRGQADRQGSFVSGQGLLFPGPIKRRREANATKKRGTETTTFSLLTVTKDRFNR